MSKFDSYPQVNFREEYDGAEMRRFYDDFMKVNFPIDDELDPFEVWEEVLDPAKVDDFSAQSVHMHVVVVYDDAPPADNTPRRIIGGVVFEYYLMSNACLMSYFAVAPDYRKHGLGRWLLAKSYTTCHGTSLNRPGRSLEEKGTDVASWVSRVSRLQDSKVTEQLHQAVAALCSAEEAKEMQRLCDGGHDVAGALGYLFAETNAEGVEDGVLEASSRHVVLNKMGFQALKFGYIQPPLSDTQGACYDLLLLTLQGSPASPPPSTPSLLLKLFLIDFALSVFGCIGSFEDHPWWKQMSAEMATMDGVVAQYSATPWPHRTPAPEGEGEEE